MFSVEKFPMHKPKIVASALGDQLKVCQIVCIYETVLGKFPCYNYMTFLIVWYFAWAYYGIDFEPVVQNHEEKHTFKQLGHVQISYFRISRFYMSKSFSSSNH